MCWVWVSGQTEHLRPCIGKAMLHSSCNTSARVLTYLTGVRFMTATHLLALDPPPPPPTLDPQPILLKVLTRFNMCRACIFSADVTPLGHPLPRPLETPAPAPPSTIPIHSSILCRLAEGVNGDAIATQLHEKLPNGCSLLPEQVEYVVLRIAKSMLQVCYLVYTTP